jgi:hypothetical protein
MLTGGWCLRSPVSSGQQRPHAVRADGVGCGWQPRFEMPAFVPTHEGTPNMACIETFPTIPDLPASSIVVFPEVIVVAN